MNFRIITRQLIQILGDSAEGRFTVTGYQRQGLAASQVRSQGNVQVFFGQGDFPKSGGRAYGATAHEMTFGIKITASGACKANLAAINNPAATPDQISSALAAMTVAEFEADANADAVFELVYQILMDARNADLGLPVGMVADRWVTQLKKEDPEPRGTLVTISGMASYTCKTVEDIRGDAAVALTDGVDVGLDLVEGDSLVKAGALGVRQVVGIIYDDGSAMRVDDGAPMQWG